MLTSAPNCSGLSKPAKRELETIVWPCLEELPTKGKKVCSMNTRGARNSFDGGDKTARLGSSTSKTVTRIEQGLLIVVFAISIGAIGLLTTYYVRSPSPSAYAFTGGSGELWLVVVAISALGGFFIVSLDQQQNERLDEEREDPP